MNGKTETGDVTIICHGDTSVGIPNAYIYLELPGICLGDDLDIDERIKSKLGDAFSEIYDAKCDVYFSELLKEYDNE